MLTDDEEIRRDHCARLLATTPRGVDRRPHPPSRLFDRIVGLAAGELDLAESGRYREFWAETLPGALRLPFRGVRNPLQDNLHDLREWVAREPEWLARP
ncbi:hypothetical protein C8D88_105323 [Lentzea atacamensis]|uniref:Uncharacterized protein n=2 Tax=Lentzea TaxID=165301 RepID=A0A316I1T6_9PSEU|nr:hypothetical protein [Lentzea atacamensis]PWK86280.1 hypothetical protein C8D88_105323 [Lentzea atacamensis]